MNVQKPIWKSSGCAFVGSCGPEVGDGIPAQSFTVTGFMIASTIWMVNVSIDDITALFVLWLKLMTLQIE